MKAKLKDKRLLLTAVFFCALAVVLLWPTGVKAAGETGDFTVTGGMLGADYSYSGGILTVKTNTALTIKNTDPSKVTTNGIVVDKNVTGANITLSGVNIDHSPSFDIKAGASVNLTLSSDNTLHAIESSSDVGLNLASSAAVTINGEGSLLCGSGNSSAAAVSGGTVTVNGGTVMASAGPWSTGIQVGTLNIKGGTVQATGRGNPGIKGGTVNVSGGTLTANGGGSGAGINSDVTISGGTVTATGGGEGGAGIGGNVGEAGKTVTISGGMVIATGGTGNGMGGAGIGGGYNGAGGTVNISGGTIVANAGYQSAGIGGGNGNNGGGGAVTITGGNVNTVVIGYGNDSSGGDFIITGGSINATFRGSTLKNGSGEGAQDLSARPFTLQDSNGNSVKNTTIQSLTIGSYISTDGAPDPSATPPIYGIKDVQTDDEGKLYFYLPNEKVTNDTPVTVTAGGTDYVGKAGWQYNTLKPFAGDIDLSDSSGNLYIWDDGYMRGNNADESAKKTYTGDYTLTGGTADTPTGNTVIVKDGYTGGDPAEGGKTITLNGVNISASTSFMIEANASVNLKLSGDNTLKGTYGAGLRVPVGAAVTIDGTAGTDSLTATGGDGMGIGGGYYAPCGKIIITGGSINATGTVGIGGWGGDSSQTIEITGGEIKANSIGSGQGGSATVTISGGTVTTNENISSSGLVTISGGTVNTKKSRPTRSL